MYLERRGLPGSRLLSDISPAILTFLKRLVLAARVTMHTSKLFRSSPKQQGLIMASDKPEALRNQEIPLPTILLVEDDVGVSEVLTQFIERETPYTVLAAPDAAHAFQMIDSTQPSLFLLDYQLPEMNGLELSDRLHAIKELEAVPTLMISATSPSRQAMQQRHISFLRKPFDLSDFFEAIDKLLSPRAGD